MPRAIDLTGVRFGKLTVIGRGSPRSYSSGSVWVCQCDCGNVREILASSLRKGDATSCGCNRGKHERDKYPYPRLRTIWRGMIARCENPDATSYPLYGAKGVKVCSEWKSLDKFVEWSLSHGYEDGLTIDRVDGKSEYSPVNCRWVSKIEQQNNRCNNHSLTVNGKTDTIANWARYSGLSHSTISARIRMGWSDERAVLTPRRKYSAKTQNYSDASV